MQFIKNITSKDINLSKKTISDLINSSNTDNFKLLVQRADFIFPFLKERISKDFVKLVNKNNIKTLFEFTKVYSPDFEEMIVNSFLKFADENLTDEILELFETGTDEQKAYCASYFSHIKDTLAINLLYENLNSDFEPLKTNCILTLKAFGETKPIENAKENIKNSNDELEKLNDYLVLSIYNEIEFIVKNGLDSPLNNNIISILLDYNDFDSLKNSLEEEEIKRIADTIIEGYPENISLDTVLYYQFMDLIKYIKNFNDNYSKNILLLSKIKFEEFNSKDVYSFDFDKSVKQEIKDIGEFLNGLSVSIDDIVFEYDKEKPYRFNILLNVIQEYNLNNFDEDLIKTFNNSDLKCEFMARIAEILKEHNKINKIDKNVVENINNYNVKALILSYL